MRKWWRSYKLTVPEPVVLKPCGSVYVDMHGNDFTEVVYICDEPTGHEALHIDKVERVAWANHELRLRKTGSWTLGSPQPVTGNKSEEEMTTT